MPYPHQKKKHFLYNTGRPGSCHYQRIKIEKGELPLDTLLKTSSDGAAPLARGPPALGELLHLLRQLYPLLPSTQKLCLPPGARMAARAVKTRSVGSQETCEVRWCVVHGEKSPSWHRRLGSFYSFMLGRHGCLEKEGRCPHSSWYLLVIFHPHLEDNMLCPECVHRNKVLTKSLQWDHNTSKRVQLWL